MLSEEDVVAEVQDSEGTPESEVEAPPAQRLDTLLGQVPAAAGGGSGQGLQRQAGP